MRLQRHQAEAALETPAGKLILLSLRRKQLELQANYRTCTVDKLQEVQAIDHFIDTILDPEFAAYIVETYEEIKKKQG